jgi:hypothetical protein
MMVAAGLEAGLEVGTPGPQINAQTGAQTNGQIMQGPSAARGAHSTAGAGSFQSLLAALGADGNAEKIDAATTDIAVAKESSLNAAQNATASPTGKDAQTTLPSLLPNSTVNSAGVDVAQASVARFTAHSAAVFHRLANDVAEVDAASSQDAPGTKLGGSENSGKAVKRETAAEKDSAKKSALTNPSIVSPLTQNAQAWMAVPVQQNAAPQQPAKTIAAATHAAESFLNTSHGGAVHNSGLASAAAAQAGANQSAAGIEAHGQASARAVAANGAASSAASPTQQGIEPAAAAQAVSDSSFGASADTADADSLSGVVNAASASAEDVRAAHTLSATRNRIGDLSSPHAAHGAAETASASLQGHTSAVQAIAPSIGGGELSAVARDASGGHGAMNTAVLNSAPAKTMAPGAHETFAALDGDPSRGPAWLHANAHSAEAGFEDPALGWVSVRAGMAAGGVHAAVVPGTAEAAQSLGAHMAGLNNYLSAQRTPVHTLTLASPGTDAGPQNGPSQNGTAQHGQDSGARDSSGGQAGAQQAMHASVERFDPSAQVTNASSNAVLNAPLSSARVTGSISLIA